MRRLVVTAVLALLASACGVLGIGGGGTYRIEVELARSYNLFPGSPVRVLGIDVGQIRDLKVTPDDDVVVAELVIDDDVRIPADASARVVVASLLGERYIQLEPPYTGGPAMEPGGRIPVERTDVPAEFDEVLESLNRFVGGLDADEFGRLIHNLSVVLEGQGERLGRTIDQAQQAVAVLRDNGEELVRLASRLADLNATLSTRDRALGQLIEDWNTVARALAEERTDIDAALSGLVRLTTQLAEVLETHRERLEADIRALTRVGRTVDRNLDQISLLILSGAELFRHAERVFDFERNWLPLVNHSEELGNEIAETIGDRLEGVCLNLGLPAEDCAQIPLLVGAGGPLCLPPLLACDGATRPLSEAVADVLAAIPELADAATELDTPLGALLRGEQPDLEPLDLEVGP